MNNSKNNVTGNSKRLSSNNAKRKRRSSFEIPLTDKAYQLARVKALCRRYGHVPLSEALPHPVHHPRFLEADRALSAFRATLSGLTRRLTLSEKVELRRLERVRQGLKARAWREGGWTVKDGRTGEVLKRGVRLYDLFVSYSVRAHREWEARWGEIEEEARIARVRRWGREADVEIRVEGGGEGLRVWMLRGVGEELAGRFPYGLILSPLVVEEACGVPAVRGDGSLTLEEARVVMERSCIWYVDPLPMEWHESRWAVGLRFIPWDREDARLTGSPRS